MILIYEKFFDLVTI